MTATTDVTRDRWQHIWTSDGLEVWGTEQSGWRIRDRSGAQLAHLTQPGLDALGALDLYRRQAIEAERMKGNE